MAAKIQVAENAGQGNRWIDGNLVEAAALAYKYQIMIYTEQEGERLLLVLDPVNAIPRKSISIVQHGAHYEVLIDDVCLPKIKIQAYRETSTLRREFGCCVSCIELGPK